MRVRSALPGRWLLAEAAVIGVALLVAWRGQERLRLAPLLVLAACEQAALVGVLVAHGFRGDHDTSVYGQQGDMLLHGQFPRSEYPTGAVLLFAFERAIGSGSVWLANAAVMIACGLVVASAVWSCRTRWSGWLAAFVALWPIDAYVSQLRFDLALAALLAVGLTLALRERFTLAGLALGLGAALKWTPALAAAALVVWLVSSGKRREATGMVASAIAAFALLTVPFLAWSPTAVFAAYTKQVGRTITGESLPYLPLHWLGLAHLRGHIPQSTAVPVWANATATTLQLVLVAAVIGLAALTRKSLPAGVTVAGLAPAVFLLWNRVFSAQFILVLLTCWAIGIALLAHTRQQQLALATAAAGATLANAFIYPYTQSSPAWQICSTVLFTLSLTLTAFLLRAAFIHSRQTVNHS